MNLEVGVAIIGALLGCGGVIYGIGKVHQQTKANSEDIGEVKRKMQIDEDGCNKLVPKLIVKENCDKLRDECKSVVVKKVEEIAKTKELRHQDVERRFTRIETLLSELDHKRETERIELIEKINNNHCYSRSTMPVGMVKYICCLAMFHWLLAGLEMGKGLFIPLPLYSLAILRVLDVFRSLFRAHH